MVAEAIKQAVEPQGVRRSFLEAAYQEVEARHTQQAAMPMTWADLPADRLVRMARAVIVIQRFWRNRKARQANSMHVLDKFARWVAGAWAARAGWAGWAGWQGGVQGQARRAVQVPQRAARLEAIAAAGSALRAGQITRNHSPPPPPHTPPHISHHTSPTTNPRSCVIRGFVVFMCGSTGISGDSLRYLRMLAGAGAGAAAALLGLLALAWLLGGWGCAAAVVRLLRGCAGLLGGCAGLLQLLCWAAACPAAACPAAPARQRQPGALTRSPLAHPFHPTQAWATW